MKILIFAPDLSGHHQVYIRVITRILLDAGHEVVLASPSSRRDWVTRWQTLKPLADHASVQDIDVRKQRVCTAEDLEALQRGYRIDATLFTHADYFAGEFRRIADGVAPRLWGRTCAIFSDACEWYPGEDRYTGQRQTLAGKPLRHILGHWKRALLKRRESITFFYETVLLRDRVVDAVCVKDERIAEHFGPPVYWMPEIYRVHDLSPEERRGPDYDQFAEPVIDYIERAGQVNVLLYFGTGAWYKGYDRFLQLAHADTDTFALHAGAPDRREPSKSYDVDVGELRQDLLRQGRLFETSSFVDSQDLVDLVFSRIGHFVSTHRLTLSSGTALQALEQGTPLLTPDSGLIGWRTRTFKLGATYAYGNLASLKERWRACRDTPPAMALGHLSNYMQRYSLDEVRSFFLKQFDFGA